MASPTTAVSEGKLYCQTCGDPLTRELDAGELQDLFAFGKIDLPCEICNKTTDWSGRIVDRRGKDEEIVRKIERREENRRAKRRVHVSLPIRIRCDEPNLKFVEVKRTLEASREGASFVLTQEVKEGMFLYIILSYSEGDAIMETKARVTHVSPAPGGAEVGVQFLR